MICKHRIGNLQSEIHATEFKASGRAKLRYPRARIAKVCRKEAPSALPISALLVVFCKQRAVAVAVSNRA